MPKVTSADGLTRKQRRFVAELSIDQNATRAAVAAGYSPRSASAIAKENLQKPVVRAAVEAVEREILAKAPVTRELLVAELRAIAFDPAGKPNDRRQALMDLAKLLGFIEEKRSVRVIRSISDLSDEELERIASGDSPELAH